ncbi:hypothetical protein HanIR_Chr17g0851691 [Helianthus annuus]|nr:hypothetical protein HanIR_Chr17g0851691 [Helianthus annuus]
MKYLDDILQLVTDDPIPFDLTAVRICTIPTNHNIPLKIETTHKLTNPSGFRSM